MGKLEALADAKELQLARTHSVRAIENLQAMYGYYIDKGQWKQAAALFAAKGTYEFGQSGVYVGNARIERGAVADGTAGPGARPAQQLRDGAAHHPHRRPTTAPPRRAGAATCSCRAPARGDWGGGVYENEYVNDKGTWKFSKLHYYVTFWGDYDAGLGRQAHSHGSAQHHLSAGPAAHGGV